MAYSKAKIFDRSWTDFDSFYYVFFFHTAFFFTSRHIFRIVLRSKVQIAELAGTRNVYLFMTYEIPKENEGWPTFPADRATSVGGGISGHDGRIILRPSYARIWNSEWKISPCFRLACNIEFKRNADPCCQTTEWIKGLKLSSI